MALLLSFNLPVVLFYTVFYFVTIGFIYFYSLARNFSCIYIYSSLYFLKLLLNLFMICFTGIQFFSSVHGFTLLQFILAVFPFYSIISMLLLQLMVIFYQSIIFPYRNFTLLKIRSTVHKTCFISSICFFTFKKLGFISEHSLL